MRVRESRAPLHHRSRSISHRRSFPRARGCVAHQSSKSAEKFCRVGSSFDRQKINNLDEQLVWPSLASRTTSTSFSAPGEIDRHQYVAVGHWQYHARRWLRPPARPAGPRQTGDTSRDCPELRNRLQWRARHHGRHPGPMFEHDGADPNGLKQQGPRGVLGGGPDRFRNGMFDWIGEFPHSRSL